MPAPLNYDDATTILWVDPNRLFQYATVDLPAEVKVIGDSIGNIFNIWQGLKLGWVGTSAAEAQDFGDQIDANLKQLFGTSDGPGVLSTIADAIAKASINFAATEDVVIKMFWTLLTDLDAPPTNGPPDRNNNDGSTSETTAPYT